mmetsp:Transcript_103289/g.274723  ORF Transcript_103289/g.274723 Transcript_103289/m.274723 type:complete len:254 (-) Transcript_103289:91-852(-)
MGNAECRRIPKKVVVSLQETCSASGDVTSRSVSSTHGICIGSRLDPSLPYARGRAGGAADPLAAGARERVEAIPSLEEFKQAHNLKHISCLKDMTSAPPVELVTAHLHEVCCKRGATEHVVKVGRGSQSAAKGELSEMLLSEDVAKWESTLEDAADPNDRPTLLLQQFKGLPSRGCRKEEGWADSGAEAADDDLESNLETSLGSGLDAVATVFQRHVLDLEVQCAELERRCLTKVGAWYEEATMMLEDRIEDL